MAYDNDCYLNKYLIELIKGNTVKVIEVFDDEKSALAYGEEHWREYSVKQGCIVCVFRKHLHNSGFNRDINNYYDEYIKSWIDVDKHLEYQNRTDYFHKLRKSITTRKIYTIDLMEVIDISFVEGKRDKYISNITKYLQCANIPFGDYCILGFDKNNKLINAEFKINYSENGITICKITKTENKEIESFFNVKTARTLAFD